MAVSQKHEKVVDSLAKDIFLGRLKPDIKLPTGKQLSEEMGIDRTSLRLGLKQPESMKVLSTRRGDGIYVNDYLKNAGVEMEEILPAKGRQGLRGRDC
jgi:GntR family transcriptional repressor for pyruvate dehydrogenase complex